MHSLAIMNLILQFSKKFVENNINDGQTVIYTADRYFVEVV